MVKLKAAITGIQGYVPDYILTNKELETMVDTNDEWIVSRTGVKERRILKGEGRGTSELGAEALKGLLEKTNTSADEIDLIICATATPDMPFPSTACIIADKVGALLMADIAHPAGLTASKLLNDPAPHCHILNTTTHKTLRGPRGWMIMMGSDFENTLVLTTPSSNSSL